MKTQPTFHESVNATMQSNNWPYAYALGYCSGKDDRQHNRKCEVSTAETTEYALGYSKAFYCPRGYGEYKLLAMIRASKDSPPS